MSTGTAGESDAGHPGDDERFGPGINGRAITYAAAGGGCAGAALDPHDDLFWFLPIPGSLCLGSSRQAS